MEKFFVTPLGLKILQQQLKHLKEVERPKNIEEIERALEYGDLRENAEYQYAKEQQGKIHAKITQLEDQLARAQVIDPAETKETERVFFGATVTLVDVDTDEEVTYTIVGSPEADPKKGWISVYSPLAKALLGKEIGDEVEFKSRIFEIVDVEYKPIEEEE